MPFFTKLKSLHRLVFPKFGTVLLLLAYVLNSLSFSSQAFAAAPPSIISYQGRLADSSGNLLGGSGTTYYFKFSIWNNATVDSGTRLWPASAPTASSFTVRQGVFIANIGDTASGYPHALDYDFSTAGDVYLEVSVSSDNSSFQTLSPRQRISSAPFARLSGAVSGSTTPSSFGTTTPITNSVVTVEATSTSSTLLSLRAIASQIANLLQIQSSSGINLVAVSASGGLMASSTLQASGAVRFYDTAQVDGLLSLIQASSSRISVFDTLYVGGSATTTIQGNTQGTSTIQGFLNVLGTNSTSTFSGGLAATYLNLTGTAGTSTVAGGLAVTNFVVSGTASSTSLVVSSLNAAACDLKSTNGVIICGTDANTAFEWTPTTNFGVNANSTSTAVWLRGAPYSLFASSTAVFSNASTTQLTLGTNFITSLSTGLVISAAGAVTVDNLENLAGTLDAASGGTGINTSSSNGIAVIDNGTWSASSTLAAYRGGTGWASVQANALLLGNGAGRLATTSAGTDGYTLALVNGVPTWQATSTLLTITGTLSIANGGTAASSFSTSGNALYYTGSVLATAPLTSAITIPYASSTGLTVSGNASSTSLVVSGLNAAACDLKSLNGVISCGTDATGSNGIGWASTTDAFSVYFSGRDYVGIGTSSPLAKVDIAGTLGSQTDLFNVSSTTATNVVSSLFRILTSGKVGIGTTSPTSLFSVQGNSYFSGTSFFGGALTATSTLNVTGLTTLVNATTTQLTTTNSTYLATSGGFVGVGTTTPSNLFSVHGAGYISSTLFVGGAITSTSSVASIFPYASTTGLSVSGSAYFATTGGNVGIGTSTPTSPLSVQGSGYLSSNLFVGGTITATGTAAHMLLSLNGSNQLTATSTPTAAYYLATSSIASIFPYASTTALTVSGTASTTSLTISGLTISRIPYLTTGGLLTDNSALTFDGVRLLATYASSTSLTVSNSAYFATTGGSVGIGTTTPGVFLSIHGAGYISSNLFVGGTLTSTSSRASTFPYASTTALTVSGTASSTSLVVSELNATACDLKSTNGVISCGTDAQGTGTYPFTPALNFGVLTSATSSALTLTGGLYASSTIRFGNALQLPLK